MFKTYNQFLNENIDKYDLKQVERIADHLFSQYGIDVTFTRHFLERVNHSRNKPEITKDELVDIFKRMSIKYGEKFENQNIDWEVVIKDLTTKINLPTIIKKNKKGDDELIHKTIMRKKDFKTHTPTLKL